MVPNHDRAGGSRRTRSGGRRQAGPVATLLGQAERREQPILVQQVAVGERDCDSSRRCAHSHGGSLAQRDGPAPRPGHRTTVDRPWLSSVPPPIEDASTPSRTAPHRRYGAPTCPSLRGPISWFCTLAGEENRSRSRPGQCGRSLRELWRLPYRRHVARGGAFHEHPTEGSTQNAGRGGRRFASEAINVLRPDATKSPRWAFSSSRDAWDLGTRQTGVHLLPIRSPVVNTGQPPLATARSTAMESCMTSARSRSSPPLDHRSKATRNTVMPASAARLAWGSPTPLWCRAFATAAA